MFGQEPFALQHVYVETECGKLTWAEISGDGESHRRTGTEGSSGKDPFSERHGGRQPLVTTVMELLGDPQLRDAIVIQGVAGSGKSCFTQRLCVELLTEGLQPIRIRLKDLRLDLRVDEALPEAVELMDSSVLIQFQEERSQPFPADLFMGGQIFNDATVFRGTRICRYVLILDGWDELSVSASEGFKIRVEKMLEQIRNEYLNKPLPIRVILAGRPSDAVMSNDATKSSIFLRRQTPVLTLRPLQPEQLEKSASDLSDALVKKPIPIDNPDAWALPPNPKQHFARVFEKYREEFDAMMKAAQSQKTSSSALSSQM